MSKSETYGVVVDNRYNSHMLLVGSVCRLIETLDSVRVPEVEDEIVVMDVFLVEGESDEQDKPMRIQRVYECDVDWEILNGKMV